MGHYIPVVVVFNGFLCSRVYSVQFAVLARLSLSRFGCATIWRHQKRSDLSSFGWTTLLNRQCVFFCVRVLQPVQEIMTSCSSTEPEAQYRQYIITVL